MTFMTLTPVLSQRIARRLDWPIRGAADQSRGFTAVELMVVVAIMAVLAALAAPSFQPLIEKWRVNDAREAMASTLFVARSEAIKRGGRVVLQKEPLGANCPHHTNTVQEWSCGWTVYFDANGNSTFDTGDTLLRTFPAPKSLNVMNKASVARFTFDRWGTSGGAGLGFTLSPDPAGISSPATTTLCMTNGGRTRYLAGDATCG